MVSNSWQKLRWLAFLLVLQALLGSSKAADVLRLGHFPNVTHAQAVFARAGGHFEKALGGSVRWSSFNAGPTAIEAIFAGAIDASFVGPNPAINGFIKSKGAKFVIIAGAASGGSGLVVRQDSGIRSEQDFGGKTIATPQLGNTQDVAARIWFTERKYRFKERGGNLALIPLANPDQLTLFQKGEIDGAWTVEPWLSRLEIDGKGKLFLDEKSLWKDGRYVTTQLIVSREYLAAHPDRVKQLLTSLVEVTQTINRDKSAAGEVLNAELKKETGKALPEAVLAKALQRVEFTWDPLASSLFQAAESAHRVGFIKTPPDLQGIYALGPLNEVLRDKKLPAVSEQP